MGIEPKFWTVIFRENEVLVWREGLDIGEKEKRFEEETESILRTQSAFKMDQFKKG